MSIAQQPTYSDHVVHIDIVAMFFPFPMRVALWTNEVEVIRILDGIDYYDWSRMEWLNPIQYLLVVLDNENCKSIRLERVARDRLHEHSIRNCHDRTNQTTQIDQSFVS